MQQRKINSKFNKYEINPEDIFLDSSNLSSLEIEKLEGAIGKPISIWSSNFIFIFLIFIFLIFIFQMYKLSVENYSYYQTKADNNRLNSTILFANRGQIFDRNQIPLAYNLITASNTGFLKREYIKANGFSNLLGYVNYPKSDNAGHYWQTEYLGQDGIELYYNDLLNGINGEKMVEKDVASKISGDNILKEAVAGYNLNLTIDADLQKVFFNSIKEIVLSREFISGTGILMNINNGEILTMVNYPEYNNNLFTNPNNAEDNKIISNTLINKSTPFLNRAVAGLFAPGSVVKPLIAYAALNEGIISANKNLLSKGALIIKNKYGGIDSVFKDWKAHGWIDVVRALAESSDEYFYQIGGGFENQTGLGINKIDEYTKMFGLANITGIDLPNEATGIIPTPDWKRMNFIDGEWKLGNTYHTAIGQYGFQITPIELIRYIAAIGNGGQLVTPHLLFAASSSRNQNVDQDLENETWPIVNLNLNPEHLKYVQAGMRGVVLPSGTQPLLNLEGLNIAAKSGTAEIGMKKLTINSLIVGYFPYNNPKYAFVVIMEKGKIGNTSGSVQAVIPLLTYFRDFKSEYLK